MCERSSPVPCPRTLRAAKAAGVRPTGLLAQSRHARVFATEQDGPPAVLKVLAEPADPVARGRFAREGRLGLGLRHPSLVETLRCGGDWILLADLRGASSYGRWLPEDGRRLLEGGPRDDPDTGRLAGLCGIAEALAYLHARGLVHRDVKPGNILPDAAGRLVLIDLGTLGLAGGGDGLGCDEIVGSPAWMAPEQIRGSPPQAAADIYALALVFAFALVRCAAFVGAADDVLRHRQDGGGPVGDFIRCVEAIPDTVLREFILAGLSEIPSERPPADAFARLAGRFRP